MHIVIVGATGMIGQGALRECLRDPEVTGVTLVGRSGMPQRDPKLRQLVVADLFDLPGAPELEGVDACFYCIGI